MGRPKKEINWDVVEKRMEAGCNGIEIAATLRISDDTFYIRFKKQYGKSFQDSSGHFHSAGDANIRFTQYAKAMSGNIPMLTLLGRERLGQSKDEIKLSPLEDIIVMRHQIMMLQAELDKTKFLLNDNQPKTE